MKYNNVLLVGALSLVASGLQAAQADDERFASNMRYIQSSRFLERVSDAKELLAFYNPTATRCRAAIQDPPVAPTETLNASDRSFGGPLACMIAGHKPLYKPDKLNLVRWENAPEMSHEERVNDLPRGVKNILRTNDITIITWGDGKDILWYPASGRRHALLWIKAAKTGVSNSYLTGRLFGYSAADIKAFYKRGNYNLESDKARAEKWWQENVGDIEQWASGQSDIRIMPINAENAAAEEKEKKAKSAEYVA